MENSSVNCGGLFQGRKKVVAYNATQPPSGVGAP
jgi:hypothetical protein